MPFSIHHVPLSYLAHLFYPEHGVNTFAYLSDHMRGQIPEECNHNTDMRPSNLICQHEFELSGKARIVFMKWLFLLGRIKTYIHYQELFFYKQ